MKLIDKITKWYRCYNHNFKFEIFDFISAHPYNGTEGVVVDRNIQMGDVETYRVLITNSDTYIWWIGHGLKKIEIDNSRVEIEKKRSLECDELLKDYYL